MLNKKQRYTRTVFACSRIFITTNEETIVQKLMMSIFTKQKNTFFRRIGRIFFRYCFRFRCFFFIVGPSPNFPNAPFTHNILSVDPTVMLRRFIHIYIFHKQLIHILGFYPRFSNFSVIKYLIVKFKYSCLNSEQVQKYITSYLSHLGMARTNVFGTFFSYTSFTTALPNSAITFKISSSHASSLSERTLL